MNKTNYKQYDTAWAKLPYPVNPWVIKDCGCGEVSIANCIIEMNKYKNETPKTIQPYCKQYAAPNGNGTYFAGIPKMMEHYGMTEVKEHQTVNDLWEELAKGNRVAIYLMGNRNAGSKGVHWTSSAHFVCSVGYKKENGEHWVYVKDSNSTSELRNGWISYSGNMKGDISRVWSGKIPAPKVIKTGKPSSPYKGDLPKGTVKKGDHGTDVKKLKSFLNWYFDADLLNPKNADAKTKTDKWIREFEKKNGITEDGVFGETCRKKAVKIIQKYAPYYSDHVVIGEARCNEFGTLSGGKAGDQTGNEVGMGNWYNGGWLYCYRAKDKETRLKIARAMIDTCNNANIGYNIDQPNRFAAWDNAEKNKHDIKGINKKGDTTCSQAVSMCMRAAGIPKKYAPRFCDIATLTKVMQEDTEYFTKHTGKSYLTTSANLQAGDILISSHHTVVVVKSPNNK